MKIHEKILIFIRLLQYLMHFEPKFESEVIVMLLTMSAEHRDVGDV